MELKKQCENGFSKCGHHLYSYNYILHDVSTPWKTHNLQSQGV